MTKSFQLQESLSRIAQLSPPREGKNNNNKKHIQKRNKDAMGPLTRERERRKEKKDTAFTGFISSLPLKSINS